LVGLIQPMCNGRSLRRGFIWLEMTPRGIETTGPIIQVAVVVFPIHQGHSSKRPHWSCQFLPEKAPVEATSYKPRSMRWSDKVYGILQGCCANHRSELWRIRVCCSVLLYRLDRTSALHELTVRTSPKRVCLLHGHRGCRNQNLPEGTIIYSRIPQNFNIRCLRTGQLYCVDPEPPRRVHLHLAFAKVVIGIYSVSS
jgi:hypothetical protein